MRHPVRRLLAALLVVLGAALLLVAGSTGVAQAAPGDCGYGNMTAPQCTCPTLAVSTTNPELGGTFVVSGESFEPRARVTLALRPASAASASRSFASAAIRDFTLGRVRTSAQGTFSTTVTMPRTAVGSFDVYAVDGFAKDITDASGNRCPADPSAQLNTERNRDNRVINERSTDEGTTAFTGLNILWLILLAAVLIVVGLVVARRGADRTTEVRSIHG